MQLQRLRQPPMLLRYTLSMCSTAAGCRKLRSAGVRGLMRPGPQYCIPLNSTPMVSIAAITASSSSSSSSSSTAAAAASASLVPGGGAGASACWKPRAVILAKTGLILCSSLINDDVDQLGQRQPDWILVSKELQSLLKFLHIQRKHWKVVIEQTALASV